MLKLFKKSDADIKETHQKLQKENETLEKIIQGKRKELKYIEAPLAEKLNILQAKEQELEDLLDEYGEKKLALRKKEELLLLKSKVLEEKENNFIKKTI